MISIIGGVFLILLGISVLAYILCEGDWEEFFRVMGIIVGFLVLTAGIVGGIALVASGVASL